MSRPTPEENALEAKHELLEAIVETLENLHAIALRYDAERAERRARELGIGHPPGNRSRIEAAAAKLRRLIGGEPTYTSAPLGEPRLSVSPSYLQDILEELEGS